MTSCCTPPPPPVPLRQTAAACASTWLYSARRHHPFCLCRHSTTATYAFNIAGGAFLARCYTTLRRLDLIGYPLSLFVYFPSSLFNQMARTRAHTAHTDHAQHTLWFATWWFSAPCKSGGASLTFGSVMTVSKFRRCQGPAVLGFPFI